MYTNGDVGNTFDQYEIAYILFCNVIMIMQDVKHYLPVFMSTLIISVSDESWLLYPSLKKEILHEHIVLD